MSAGIFSGQNMNVYKVLAEFIRDEVIPAVTKPDTIAGLGMVAAGLVFYGKEEDINADLVEAVIRGGFEYQPVLTFKIADFLPENVKAKFPILNIERVKNVLEVPFDIDKESAEKLLAKLKGK